MGTVKIDTPLTRLQAKYEAMLADKELELSEMRVRSATITGINELLKFELRTMESLLNAMQKGLDEMKEHVRTLKFNLPE